MANFTISPNMSLILPTVGVDPGPDWATNLNASLSIIDQHNHSPGNGVQINPDGLSINSDLTFQNNNATNLRSSRYFPQTTPLTTPTDLGETYVLGVDLYYIDGNGNQIQITKSGGIAGSPGSIADLVSPASATYVSADQTFVWESNANTAANMDGGSIILRDIVANSPGVTISPPSGLAANYTITLPASLPTSTNFVTLDASGNLAAVFNVDNSTIITSGDTIEVAPGGITATQIASMTITAAQIANQTITAAQIANSTITDVQIASGTIGGDKLQNATITNTQIAANTVTISNLESKAAGSAAGAGNIALSNSTGTFATTSTSFVLITNLSISLTTVGSPVFIAFVPDGSTNQSEVFSSNNAAFELRRNGTNIASWGLGASNGTPVSLNAIDVVGAGTYVYALFGAVVSSGTLTVDYSRLMAYEL